MQMRRHLAEARAIGQDFDSAWDRSWRQIRWDHCTEHRRNQKLVLEEHREIWRSCYMREPGPASMEGLGRLAGMLAD